MEEDEGRLLEEGEIPPIPLVKYESEKNGVQFRFDFLRKKFYTVDDHFPRIDPISVCVPGKHSTIFFSTVSLITDLDHTADVQLHSWGDDLKESFEQVAIAMFGYMTTDFSKVQMKRVHKIEAQGEDLLGLLYHFLDEFLFLFSVEPFIICRVVKITEFDMENFRIKAEGYGESFDISKHPQGTEVKAITYSNMQIHEEKTTNDIFVIIDI